MIDKSIPYYPLTMYKSDIFDYPRYDLPEGYEFVFYKTGDEVRWAEIETDVGQFDSDGKAIVCFRRDFIDDQDIDPRERMLFVKDQNGEYVATGSLWNWRLFGKEYQRIHWIAVKDKCSGSGIAKALLTRLLDMYNELGYKDTLWLLTGTPNYPAVAIYRKLGFVEYREPRSLSDKLSDEEFAKQTETAVSIIDERLSLRKK